MEVLDQVLRSLQTHESTTCIRLLTAGGRFEFNLRSPFASGGWSSIRASCQCYDDNEVLSIC